ncbi:MAG: M12 family metallopeptidase [Spirochaetes bacterium]|nr:M12 family metallopeptidase [Spirochaetota bacterium]
MSHFKQAIKLFFIIIIFSQACTFDFTIGPWKDGIIPYYLKGEFSKQDILNIREAMDSWENVCGVRFDKVRPRSSAYAIIRVSRQEWYSSIGENNSQCRMIFGRYYSDIDVIIHELGHCLGLVHEHQRPDRDTYVNIIWSNILSGKDYNFEIMDNPLYIEQDFDYDYESIMHYDPNAFSINGSPTIIAKDSSIINPSAGITDLDAAKAREIYGEPFADNEED